MASFDDMAFDERTFVSDLTDKSDNSQEEKHRMAFSQKLSKFGVDELKEKCKENNIQGYLKCKKAELIDLISLEYDKNIRLLKLLKATDLKNLCKSNKLRSTALKRPEMIDIIIEFNASCIATKFVSAADCAADVGSDEEKPKKPTVDEKEPKLSDAEQRIKNLQQIIEDIKKEKEPVEITKEESKKVKKTEEGEKVKKPKKEKEEEKEKEKERIRLEEEAEEKEKEKERIEAEEKEKEKLEKEKLEKAKKTKQPKETIPKQIKSIVWNQYIGEDVRKHKCLCCKKVSIENTNFHAGHVISEKNGGTLEIGNLRPICPSCNYSMGTENMVEFVKKYGLYIG